MQRDSKECFASVVEEFSNFQHTGLSPILAVPSSQPIFVQPLFFLFFAPQMNLNKKQLFQNTRLCFLK